MSVVPTRGNDYTLKLLDEIQPEPLTHTHIVDVGRLHYRLLFWSFNGQLGEQHIIELYRALYRSPHFFGYVYYSERQLMGFVTGTTDFEDTRRYVLEVYKRNVSRVLGVFIRHPRFLLTALESRFIVPLVFRHFGIRSEWLTFVTDTTSSYLSPLVGLCMFAIVHDAEI